MYSMYSYTEAVDKDVAIQGEESEAHEIYSSEKNENPWSFWRLYIYTSIHRP